MAILIDEDTRLVVTGLTGREGRFHAGRNAEYGTKVVAGVTPGKGGQDVDGVPVYNTVAESVDAAGANTAMVFVPARFAADSVMECYDAGIDTIVCITEHIPAMDMARVVSYLRSRKERDVTLIGPNCPGIISPGKANVGIIPGEICTEGPVGLVSRSGTLTYQIVHELSERGIGQSTCVGIGGDAIPGSDFIDVLSKFESDDDTELVVFVGEIGGDAEERAAGWAEENMSKPIVAYIAGFTAPPGKRMGHAGAIISGSSGTAQAKKEALEAAGIRVGTNPTEVAELAQESLKDVS
jgi:succinyl-CoA synthetase alpha subunit